MPRYFALFQPNYFAYFSPINLDFVKNLRKAFVKSFLPYDLERNKNGLKIEENVLVNFVDLLEKNLEQQMEADRNLFQNETVSLKKTIQTFPNLKPSPILI